MNIGSDEVNGNIDRMTGKENQNEQQNIREHRRKHIDNVCNNTRDKTEGEKS